MAEMETWQWAVVAGVALGGLAFMTFTIARMFTRRASGPAEERKASAFESALIEGVAPDGAEAFDVWSYRVAARFAGKCRVVVTEKTVAVAGPRVPRGLYEAWVWVQGLLLALVPASLVWALAALDWRGLVLGAGMWVVSLGISSLGAGLWPGLGEMTYVMSGAYDAVEFPRDAVRDLTVGPGWSRGGMDVVLLPYVKGIDAIAVDRAVSFFAPDAAGRDVRYALHVPDAEKAARLAGLLAPDRATGDSV